MQKAITINEDLYIALSEHVGVEEVDRYVEDMIRQRVADLDDWPSDEELEADYRDKAAAEEAERIAIATGVYRTDRELEAGYRAMAEDEEHEREALEWSEALAGDGIA